MEEQLGALGRVAELHRAMWNTFYVRWFQTRTLTPFAIYCLAFGALSIIRFL